MKKFETIEEILDFAIHSEQQAVDFYTKLAEKAGNPIVKQAFLEYAQEEVGHKAKLLKIKTEGIFETSYEKVPDLKLSDYILKTLPDEINDYADSLKMAMHREKAAFKLYTNIANQVKNADLKNVFFKLAEEEAKHKLRFELEYDEFVLKEN
jgi:rubrerythrin